MNKDKQLLVLAGLAVVLVLLFLVTQNFGLIGDVSRFSGGASLVQICSDSDTGQDFFTQGQVKTRGLTYDDVCVDSNQLTEYYCQKGRVKSAEQDCRELAGVCSAGRCATTEGNFFILAENADVALAETILTALNNLGHHFDNSIIRTYQEFGGANLEDKSLLMIYNGEVAVVVGQGLVDDDLEFGAAIHRLVTTLNLRQTLVSDTEINSNNLRSIFPIDNVWRITQITDDHYFNEFVTLHDYYPNLWGGRVTWLRTVPLYHGYGSLDQVFMFEQGSMRQISNITNAGTSEPDATYKNAVWFNYFTRPTFSEIYLYDGPIKQITNNRDSNLVSLSTKIWGDKLVWNTHDGDNINDIYFYDGSIHQVTTSDNNLAPDIHDKFIAWEKWVNGKSEIYFYNGEQISRLTNNSYDDRWPAIWKDHVAWYGSKRYPNDDIFYYDGTTVRQLTQSNKNSNPVVWGNNVAWQGLDNDGRWQIFVYDGQSTRRITIYTNRDASTPAIWGDVIVWTAVRSDIYDYDEAEKTREVYLYDEKEVHQITDNSYQDISPVVWGQNVAWLGRVDDEEEYEVFFAYKD